MGRLILIAVATVAVVVSLSLSPRVAAEQAANRTASFPVQITGAVPGVNLELFLNAGKVADVPINAQGEGQWVLDLGNLGKTRMQVTVERCQDGQNLQRVYFAGQGVSIPEDDRCTRRPVGAAWWSDCGVTRVTLDLTKFGMRVVGCGSMLTQPRVYGPLGGAIVVGGLILTGGGDGNTPTSFTPTTTTSTSTTPPVTTLPPVATPPVNTTPPVTTPPAPTDFSVSVALSWTHPGGTQSVACGLIATTPAQAGAPYTISTTGPGVVSGQSVTGTLNQSGRAAFQVRINSVGPYTIVVNVTVGTLQRSATGSVNVTGASNSCPSP